jgi:hypothetical protein
MAGQHADPGYSKAGARTKLSSNPWRRTRCGRHRRHPLLGRHVFASHGLAQLALPDKIRESMSSGG